MKNPKRRTAKEMAEAQEALFAAIDDYMNYMYGDTPVDRNATMGALSADGNTCFVVSIHRVPGNKADNVYEFLRSIAEKLKAAIATNDPALIDATKTRH